MKEMESYMAVEWTKFITVASLLWICLASFGQAPPDYILQKVDNFDEIANREITSIIQDKHGFLWMGSYFGLLKYDGNEIINYKPDVYNPNSIPARKIKQLIQVGDTIWIGTIEHGLCYYDCIKEEFHRLPGAQFIEHGISQITALKADIHGNIWAGTSRNLFRVNHGDPENISFFKFRTDEGISDGAYTYALCFDTYNNLWIGTGSGIYMIHHSNLTGTSDNVAVPLQVSGQEQDRSDQLVLSLACIPDQDNVSLWAGTRNGVANYRISQSSLKEAPVSDINGNYLRHDRVYRELENMSVQALLMDSARQELWIGTNEKLFKLDPSSLSITHNFHSPINQNLRIGSFYKDKHETVWVGTLAGLYRITTEKSYFKSLGDANSKEGPKYISLLIDLGSEYLCGTLSNGLYLIKQQKDGALGNMTSIKMSTQEKNMLVRDVNCAIMDRNGAIWLGTKGNGLIKLKIKGGEISEWKHYSPDDPVNPFPIDVESLAEHPNGNILVGTYAQSLIILNPEENSMQRIDKFSATEDHPSDYPITDIFIESENIIWVCTRGSGLYQIKLLGDNEFESHCFSNSEDNLNSLCDNYVNNILLDHFGGLWLGTEGGLSLLDRRTNQFRNFYEQDGLSDNCIQGIIEDNEGFLWVSTINGLNKIDTRLLLDSTTISGVRVFKKEDGLPNNFFIHGSTFQINNNQLFMGNLNGATYFDPSSMAPGNTSFNPVINAIYLHDQKIRTGEKVNGRVLLEKSLPLMDMVEFKAKENNITIQFTTPSYDYPSTTKYAYRLKGYNDNWSYAETPQQGINYLNFPTGVYTFEVKSSNPDGSWNPSFATLQIKRALPLWRSPIAFLLYIIMLIAIFLLFRKIIVQRTEWLNKIKLESYKREKNEELYQHKLRFFTNISHEIKTPLSLIIGPVKHALLSNEPSDREYALKLVQRNANRLLNLVNQLLEFRKVETENLSLRVSLGDVGLLTRFIVDDFQYYANEKKINLSLVLENEPLEGWIDRDKYEKILYNLLGNAVKYTDSEGIVNVKIGTEYDEDLGTHVVRCIVADTGIGISKNNLEHIFERYYRAIESDSGIGIGLALSKKLVEVHKGSISVTSELGKGTEFQFRLPLDEQFYAPDEIAKTEPVISSERPLIIENKLDEEEDSEEVNMNDEKILIVEDDRELRQFLKHTFQNEYRVLTAENGEEGYLKALEEKPEMVIADYMMPKLNGIELIKKLKEHHSTEGASFILLTAHLNEQIEMEISHAGADLILNKPFDPELIKIQVRNMLSKHKKIKTHVEKELLIQKSGEAEQGGKKTGTADKVIAIIDKHCSSEDFNIDFLAQEMGMSRMKLYRYIKTHFKMPPLELVRKIRMSKVAMALKENEANISEVAFKYGFNDMKYFRECFKKEYGQTPSEYIKSNR